MAYALGIFPNLSDAPNLAMEVWAELSNVADASVQDGERIAALESGKLSATGDLAHTGTKVGFYGTAPVTKPTLTGSRALPEQALKNLITILVGFGLLVDSSTI